MGVTGGWRELRQNGIGAIYREMGGGHEGKRPLGRT